MSKTNHKVVSRPMFNSPALYLKLLVIGLIVADVHSASLKFENGGEEPSESSRVKRLWDWGGYNFYYGGGYLPITGVTTTTVGATGTADTVDMVAVVRVLGRMNVVTGAEMRILQLKHL
uniref:Uncharacterized protein n=1 Tax=Plectus sambesii TaxID=2011161 RepID=A0A914V1S0_9BILA